MLSILATLGIGMGLYYYNLKDSTPAPGLVATQTISTTGVQTDLMAIAQAERVYFAQNGSYGTLDQLTSGGAMNISRTERDGYTYSVETTSDGFQVTAQHPDIIAPPGSSASSLHFPQFTVDQTMQVRQGD